MPIRRGNKQRITFEERAQQYLMDQAIQVLFADGEVVSAICSGQHGRYTLGYEPSEGWWCSCPIERECPHLLALQSIVALESQMRGVPQAKDELERVRVRVRGDDGVGVSGAHARDVAELEGQLSRARAEAAKVPELTREVDRLRTEGEILAAEVRHLRGEAQRAGDLELDVEDLRARAARAEEAERQLEEAIAEARRAARLEREVGALEDAEAARVARIADLAQAVSSRDAHIEQLERDLDSSTARRSELREELSAATARVRELEAGTASETSRVGELRAKLAERGERLDGLQHELRLREDRITRLERELAQRGAAVERLEGELAAMRAGDVERSDVATGLERIRASLASDVAVRWNEVVERLETLRGDVVDRLARGRDESTEALQEAFRTELSSTLDAQAERQTSRVEAFLASAVRDFASAADPRPVLGEIESSRIAAEETAGRLAGVLEDAVSAIRADVSAIGALVARNADRTDQTLIDAVGAALEPLASLRALEELGDLRRSIAPLETIHEELGDLRRSIAPLETIHEELTALRESVGGREVTDEVRWLREELASRAEGDDAARSAQALVSAEREQREELERDLAALRAQLDVSDDAAAARSRLEESLAAVVAERDELAARVASKDADRDDVHRRLATSEAKREELERRIAAAERDATELRKAVERSTVELGAAASGQAEMTRDVADAIERATRFETIAREQAGRIGRLEGELERVRGARRVPAPAPAAATARPRAPVVHPHGAERGTPPFAPRPAARTVAPIARAQARAGEVIGGNGAPRSNGPVRESAAAPLHEIASAAREALQARIRAAEERLTRQLEGSEQS